MAFNSENDPDLYISIDAWGRNFSLDRDDPEIHESRGSGILSIHSFVTVRTVTKKKKCDKFSKDIKRGKFSERLNKLNKNLDLILKSYSALK